MDETVKKFGRIDILVNNAAFQVCIVFHRLCHTKAYHDCLSALSKLTWLSASVHQTCVRLP